MHAIALTAGHRAELLLLVATLEAKPRAIRTRGDLPRAERDLLFSARDLLKHAVVRLERRARLIHVGNLDGVTDFELAAVRLVFTDQHAKKRGFTGAIRADHTHDSAARQPKVQTVDQQAIAEALAQGDRVDHVLTQARPGRNADLGRITRALVGLAHQLLVGGEASLALGLTRAW